MRYLLIFMLIVSGCKEKEPVIDTARIFLYDHYNLPDTLPDKKLVLEFSFVTGVGFTSKEEAKKKYLEDGGEEWSKIIGDENPLPASLDVDIDMNELSEEEADRFKSEIKKKIAACSDIQMPGFMKN